MILHHNQYMLEYIPHNELLLKLWSIGITGNTWKLLQAYLNQRVQCVSVNNNVSSHLLVLSGIPQGCILGPLLFLIFVNDIPDSADLLLFADDTKCFHHSSDCDSLQCDLNNLSAWSNLWNLHF